jgi:hypothetical protein
MIRTLANNVCTRYNKNIELRRNFMEYNDFLREIYEEINSPSEEDYDYCGVQPENLDTWEYSDFSVNEPNFEF